MLNIRGKLALLLAGGLLIAGLVLPTGCGGDEDTSDDDDNSDPTQAEPSPTPGLALSLAITYPADGKKVGNEITIEGSCSLPGALVTVEGDASAYAACENSGTWEATLDLSAASNGQLAIQAILSQEDATSEPASLTLVKDSSSCDSEANRDDVFANYSTGGDGDAVPYEICNAVQLTNIRYYTSSSFILRNDIDLHGTPLTLDITFTGQLDGNGFVIRNLWLHSPDREDVGLFQYLSGSSLVKNLGLEQVDILGANRVGALAGRLRENARAEGIAISGSVVGLGNIGGLAGYIDSVDERIAIVGSSFDGEVQGESSVGGLIGGSPDNKEHSLLLEECDVNGTIDGTGPYVGGLAGNLYITGAVSVLSSHVTADLSTDTGTFLGGLVGRARHTTVADSSFTGSLESATRSTDAYVGGLLAYGGSGASIERSTVVADIIANGGTVGGLAGRFLGTALTGSSFEGDITANSWLEEDLTVVARYVGGLVGSTQSATTLEIRDSQHIGNILITGETASYGVGGAFGYLEVQDLTMSDVDNIGDVENQTPGAYNIGGLIGQLHRENGATSSVNDCTAEGDVSGSSASQVGGLVGSLVLGLESMSIASCSASGTVSSSGDSVNVGGLFGYINLDKNDIPGVNLTLDTCSSAGSIEVWNATYVGGLIGQLNPNMASVVSLSNSSSSSQISTSANVVSQVGGLIGRISAGHDNELALNNLSSSINVSIGEDYVGGMIGYLSIGDRSLAQLDHIDVSADATGTGSFVGGVMGALTVGASSSLDVSNVESSGAILGNDEATTEEFVGGIAGYVSLDDDSSGSFDALTSTGSISAKTHDYVGGLFGAYSPNPADEPVTHIITSSSALGDISTTGSYVGGLIGQLSTRSGISLTMSDCFAEGDVSGASLVGGAIGYIRGRGTGDMDILSTYATGSVYSSSSYTGGMVGLTALEDSSSGIFEACYAEGDVSVEGGDYHGGLIGGTSARLEIHQCYALGDVIGHGRYQGGLVGGSSGADQAISSSFATGNVSSGNENGTVGGLAGLFRGILVSSFAIGDVSGMEDTGGLVGYLYSNDASAPLDDCYYSGTVTRGGGSAASASHFGHIFGRHNEANPLGDALFFNSDLAVEDASTGSDLSDANDSGNGLSSSQMKSASNFEGFAFDSSSADSWSMPSSGYALPGSSSDYKYPILNWMK